jgi:hypothetical protein
MRTKPHGQKTIFDEWVEQKIKHNRTSILEEADQYVDFEICRPLLESIQADSGYGPQFLTRSLCLRWEPSIILGKFIL